MGLWHCPSAHLPLDESGFRNACNDAPDDFAPRLIFADWLDQREDPRGTVTQYRPLANIAAQQGGIGDILFV